MHATMQKTHAIMTMLQSNRNIENTICNTATEQSKTKKEHLSDTCKPNIHTYTHLDVQTLMLATVIYVRQCRTPNPKRKEQANELKMRIIYNFHRCCFILVFFIWCCHSFIPCSIELFRWLQLFYHFFFRCTYVRMWVSINFIWPQLQKLGK